MTRFVVYLLFALGIILLLVMMTNTPTLTPPV